jgi:hypothetical protein
VDLYNRELHLILCFLINTAITQKSQKSRMQLIPMCLNIIHQANPVPREVAQRRALKTISMSNLIVTVASVVLLEALQAKIVLCYVGKRRNRPVKSLLRTFPRQMR